MSRQELKRVEVIALRRSGQVKQGEAARRLGLTVRQMRRLEAKVAQHGAAGLRSARRGHPTHAIDAFNCPMGLGILPDGSILYVATQCGSGRDPVFVVNTGTDKIVNAIQDFAVGSEVAVAGKSLRVYVSRSKFLRLDPNGNRIEEPAQISVIDPARNERVDAETINDGGSALTVSPNGQFLFFSTSRSIEILNTESKKRSSIALGSAATDIAVRMPDRNSSSLVLYAWIPEQNRIFFTGLDGLLP